MIKVSAATTVMISVEKYHRLKRRDRRVIGLEEEIRAPQAAKAFDSELKSS